MKKPSIEEQIALALIHYINAQPDHQYGLCFWVSEACLDHANPYMLFGNFAKKLGYWGKQTDRGYGTYIGNQHGQTRKRRALASRVLKGIETGQVSFNADAHMWEATA